MPHVYRDRNMKFMVKLQLERMASPERMDMPLVLMSRGDFGTAIEPPRIYSETLGFKRFLGVVFSSVEVISAGD